MQADTFIKQVQESFPCQRPDPSRLFEGVRTESGCEKLDFFVHVEWPDLIPEMLEGAAEEFWQMSSVWVKYFLPAFMCLTAKYDFEVEAYHLDTGTFIEIKEDYDALTSCLSSYWFSIERFMSEEFAIITNVFFGLTSEQINLVEIWLKNFDFETLHRADELYADFDFSPNGISAFIEKARKFTA